MVVTDQLIKDNILTAEDAARISQSEHSKVMTVHWELKTILYLGVLLLVSGISIFVYQNIQTIGHTAVIAVIAAGCGACFYYATRNRRPYSHDEVKNASPLFDYIVLLGCLLFGIFIAYMQFQYVVFGEHYGIATFVPALLYLGAAYLFDHKGVLSLGITGMAAWAGISVTPGHLLENNDFESSAVIITSLFVGATLALYPRWAEQRGIKKHFGFTYNNFACNILCISLLAYLFNDNMPVHYIAFVALAGVTWYYIRYAISRQSFWFLLLATIYAYTGLTYLVFRLLFEAGLDTGVMMFGMLYVMASCAGIVLFFIYHKRILKLKP
jgi:hypothetical protein